LCFFTSSFLWISAHNSQAKSSTIQPFDGLWHYVCASWTSSTSTVNLYLDVDQVTDSLKVESSGDADSGSPLARDGCITIGQLVASSDSDCTLLEPGYSFEGYITDITLWSKNLNVSEVGRWSRTHHPFLCQYMCTFTDGAVHAKIAHSVAKQLGFPAYQQSDVRRRWKSFVLE
jgi:Pentaxin family